jgi:hypothetical protein
MRKNDGVLTTSDFIKQKTIEKEQVKKPVSFSKNVKIERRYFFRPAPMGKSHVSITFEEKPMKIELIDGIFSPPKNWSENKLQKFNRVIQLLGFEDKCYVVGQGKQKEKKEKKYIYAVGHPDNTADEKVTGNVAIKVGKKEYKFKLTDGVIETKEKSIYNAFIKKGWYEVSIKEDKES